jgi:uncharacterized protein
MDTPPGSDPLPNQPTPPPADNPPPAATASPAPGPGPTIAPSESNKDDRTLAMVAHLIGIVTSFLGPLVIWIMKKEQRGYLEDQAREALNFQLTLLMVWAAWFVLTLIPFIGCFIGPLSIVIFVGTVVLGIIAAIKANDGVAYRYPFCIRLIAASP